VVRFRTHRWLLVLFLGLAAAAGAAAQQPPAAQERPTPPALEPRPEALPPTGEVIRFSRNVPGDAKPIVIDADEIAAWKEGERLVVLLRGQVLLQQGFVLLRCQEAVGWVDLTRHQSGLLHVDLYAEGGVRLDVSAEVRDGPKALIELNTRGEFKLTPHRSPVVRQALPNEPLYQRAQMERAHPAARPAAPTPTPPPAPQAPPQRIGQAAPPPFIARGAAPDASPAPSVGPGPSPLPAGIDQLARETPPAAAIGEPVVLTAMQAPTGPGGTPDGGAPVEPFRSGPRPPAETPTPPLPPPSKATPHPPAAPGPPQRGSSYTVLPRTGGEFDSQTIALGGDEQAIVVTNGVIINVRNAAGVGFLDLEADRLVIYTRTSNSQQFLNSLRTPQTSSQEQGQGRQIEFYLSGNVEIRELAEKNQTRTIRAEEVYYDVKRSVAVALSAVMETTQPNVPDKIYFKADEMFRTSETTYEVTRSEIFSSKLPSDPGFKVYVAHANIEEKTLPRYSPFGLPILDRKTGQQVERKETFIEAKNAFFEIEDVPFLYTPYLYADAREPLGPLQSVAFGYSRIYGFIFGATFDAYELFGIQPIDNTRWHIDLNYLTERGPAVGTNFDYTFHDLFGAPGRYSGEIAAYGIYDQGTDILGGNRLSDFKPDAFRGRFQWRQDVRDLPYGFSVQSSINPLSDRNFLEEYYKREFDTDWNQATYVYVKQQQNEWAWTAGVQPGLRAWVTEAQRLPEVSGYLIGEDFFNLLTYSAGARAGYYQLRRTSDIPPYSERAVSVTDVNDDTGRFDVMQELDLPLALGPVKLVPYVKADLAEYTNDLNNEEIGRVWGGAGVRASIPFTRLYPDVQSELFNLDGINHKIVLSANYFYADSNEPYNRFPQLDRLNDDASDQLVRDIRLFYPFILPSRAAQLTLGPQYDPQNVANRRLVDTSIDTLDAMDVFQVDLRQRLQTKRGFPGSEHIVDWMTLDVSASFYPDAKRDNFNSTIGEIEYNYLWNIGDRTSLSASGLIDPYAGGAHIYSVGANFNRPDRTSFYLGYLQVEPLQSRAVVGSVTYIFSPKYSMSVTSSYDFGQNTALGTIVAVTRTGTDMQVTLGATYSALTNSFGILFEIVPNLVPPGHRTGALSAVGQGGLLH
jgi:hypothetical protein